MRCTGAPDYASAHVGLANACIMQFEMTRADPAPDIGGARPWPSIHAREACRLDPQSGEAWATLGFVLERTGNRLDARAASKRAVTLEPDNWRHHFRLSYVSWGEERLRAAHETLALLPGFPLAHWLAATVHVARQALGEADRELAAGARADAGQPIGGLAVQSSGPALAVGPHSPGARRRDASARGVRARAVVARMPVSSMPANARQTRWYTIGRSRLRQGRPADASAAFAHAIERVPTHPMARVGLAAAGGVGSSVMLPRVDAAPAVRLW